MKTATLPPLRVEPQLRKNVERLLEPGETLSTFVEQAVRESVERRLADADFASRALTSRAAGQKTERYHSAASVMRELKDQTKAVRRRQAREQVTSRYEVRFTDAAREDLLELHAFLAEHSIELAESALGTIERALTVLEEFAWSCRASTALPRSRFRELVISFGRRGYVALFEIEGDEVVTVLAVRNQRESDCH